jgi:hypothetical protein
MAAGGLSAPPGPPEGISGQMEGRTCAVDPGAQGQLSGRGREGEAEHAVRHDRHGGLVRRERHRAGGRGRTRSGRPWRGRGRRDSARLPAQPDRGGGVARGPPPGGTAGGAAGARRVRLSLRLSDGLRGAAHRARRSAGRLGVDGRASGRWALGQQPLRSRRADQREVPGGGAVLVQRKPAGDRPPAAQGARPGPEPWHGRASDGRGARQGQLHLLADGGRRGRWVPGDDRDGRARTPEAGVSGRGRRLALRDARSACGLCRGLAIAHRRRREGRDAGGGDQGRGPGPRACPCDRGGGPGRVVSRRCSTQCRRTARGEEGWILGVGAEEALAFR